MRLPTYMTVVGNSVVVLVMCWCVWAGAEKFATETVPSMYEAVEARREPLSNLWTVKKEPERPVLVRIAYTLTENGEYVARKASQGWNAAVAYFN